MPRILQRNPDGTVLYEQADGSVVTLPEYALPPEAVDAAPDQASLQSGAPASPDPGPVPDVAWQPPPQAEIEMPGEAADDFSGAAVVPDAVSGADPATPPAPPAPPPLAAPGSGVAGNAPVDVWGKRLAPAGEGGVGAARDPYEQQAAAQLAVGAAGADLARRTADLQAATQRAVAPIEQQRAEAAAKIAARQAELADAHAKAIDEQSKFDLREPRSTVAGSVRKILALTLGVVGQALMREGGQLPVLAVLERKAKEAADARLRRYSQLGQTVKAKGEALDRLADVAKSQDAYYQMAIATEWDKYAQTAKAMAMQAGADQAQAESLVASAGFLVKRDEARAKADEVAWNQDRDEAKLVLEAEAAETARMNALTSRGQLGLGWAQHKQRVEEDKFARAAKLDEMRRLWHQALKEGDTQKASMLRINWEMAKYDDERTVAGGRIVPAKGPDGKPILDEKGTPKSEWRGWENSDGSAYRTKDPQARAKLDEQVIAAYKLIDVIDRIQELRNSAGSEVDFLKSDAWRQMQANYGTAAPIWAQSMGLGVLNGPDLDLFQKAIGTNDPTEIRNIDEGLQEGRRIIQRNMNRNFQSAWDKPKDPKVAPPEFDIPNITSQGLLEGAGQDEAGQLTQRVSASVARGDDRRAALARQGRGGFTVEEGKAKYAPALDVSRETLNTRPTEEEERDIEALAALAKSGDDSARDGLASLIKSKRGAAESAAARIAVEQGIDLSDKLGAERWRQIVDTLTSAKRGRVFSGAAGR